MTTQISLSCGEVVTAIVTVLRASQFDALAPEVEKAEGSFSFMDLLSDEEDGAIAEALLEAGPMMVNGLGRILRRKPGLHELAKLPSDLLWWRTIEDIYVQICKAVHIQPRLPVAA